jgi:hypothetical protein
MRRGPEMTEPVVPMPVMPVQRIAHDAPTVTDVPIPPSTEEKARTFELELLDQVYEREATNDREGLQRLGQAHPPGSEVGDAARAALARMHKAQEEEQAFQRAWEDGRSNAWREFLEKHAGSPRVDEARRFADEAGAFESATKSESETAVRQFLAAWPEARHHLEAGILLAKLKQRSADKRAYEDARKMNTVSAWRLYLTAYPNGAYADEARERIAASQKLAADAVRAKRTGRLGDRVGGRYVRRVGSLPRRSHPTPRASPTRERTARRRSTSNRPRSSTRPRCGARSSRPGRRAASHRSRDPPGEVS